MEGILIRPKLEAAILDAMDRACATPMQWGKDDCALWCADILHKCLGYDPGSPFRGRYRTRRGAALAMGRPGLVGVLRTAARKHGWKAIAPSSAQPGDLGIVQAMIDGKPITSTVICRAPGWFVGRNEMGVTALPASSIKMCWKVARHRSPRPLQFGSRINLHRPLTASGVKWPEPVHEPVSAAIGLTALVEAVIGGTAIFGVTAASIGGAIVATGISIGLNYAASALLQRGNQPLPAGVGAANDPSIRYNERQAIPNKRIIYGTAQVGGALFFEQTLNPFLYQGLLICAKPIKAFRKIWIGTNELSFASLAPNTILTPSQVDGQPLYSTHLKASFRLGASNQTADAILVSDFPNIAGSLISQATGTPIGNLTGGGGLAIAFDGNFSQKMHGAGSCASIQGTGNLAGTVGKNWGAPKGVSGFRVTGSTDDGFTNSIVDSTVTFKLQGSTDNFASSIVDLLAIPPNIYPSQSPVVIAGDPTISAAYNYHRVLISELHGDAASHTLGVCEVEFFASSSGQQFLQQGIATAVLRYNFGATQDEYTSLWGQSQRPNPIFLVDGIAVPDPRNPAHIVQYDPSDPAAVAAAEATWTWSRNAALCQAHYLTQPYGGRIDPRRVDWDKVAEAADWDDGLIGTTEGEMIPRGTIDGLITLNQPPSDVISSMLSANRGFVLESSGRVWVSSSKPKASVTTIYDAILSGAIEYRAAKPKRDMINRLKVRFVAEDREYQSVDGPILDRPDLQATDQEILEGTLELPFTLDNRRAQMLQKSFLDTARLGRRISCICDVRILANCSDELVGSAVIMSSDLFPQFNGTYFVESWGFTDQFSSVQISLSEYDPAIESDWHPEDDQQPFVLADINLT